MKTDEDRYYLDWAMILARAAFNEGFSPVGAVVVTESGAAYPASSRREIGNIKHAELLALMMCQESLTLMKPVTLYSTLEPCIMCAGMAAVMGIKQVKWLVDDVLGGVVNTINYNSSYIQKQFPTLDKVHLPDLHKEAREMQIEYLEKK